MNTIKYFNSLIVASRSFPSQVVIIWKKNRLI